MGCSTRFHDSQAHSTVEGKCQQSEPPPGSDARKDLHERLLDRKVEQIDAVREVAERNFWRPHEPEPDSQIGDWESREIAGVGELQQHGGDKGREQAETGEHGILSR